MTLLLQQLFCLSTPSNITTLNDTLEISLVTELIMSEPHFLNIYFGGPYVLIR